MVSLPAVAVSAIADHSAAFVDDDPEAFVFTGLNGRPIWRGTFNKMAGWQAAVAKVGQPVCISTICGIPATPSPPGREPAPATSWRGWVTTAGWAKAQRKKNLS